MLPNDYLSDELAALLHPADKTVCDSIFERYKSLQEIIKTITKDGWALLYDYNEDSNEKSDIFQEQALYLSDKMREIKSLIHENSIALINAIENYFKKKYKLEFHSMVHTEPEDEYPLFTQYDNIITNILNQHGGDAIKVPQ